MRRGVLRAAPKLIKGKKRVWFSPCRESSNASALLSADFEKHSRDRAPAPAVAVSSATCLFHPWLGRWVWVAVWDTPTASPTPPGEWRERRAEGPHSRALLRRLLRGGAHAPWAGRGGAQGGREGRRRPKVCACARPPCEGGKPPHVVLGVVAG